MSFLGPGFVAQRRFTTQTLNALFNCFPALNEIDFCANRHSRARFQMQWVPPAAPRTWISARTGCRARFQMQLPLGPVFRVSISRPTSCRTRFQMEWLGKDLAPCRIGKHSNPQNSPKKHQKYSNNTIFGIFGVFLSYFARGGVFLFCRGPSFLQGMASWTDLSYMDLSINWLSGELPAVMAFTTDLQQIWILTNRFSGNIPDALASWTSLLFLDFSINQLSGEIPEAMGLMQELNYIFFNINRLSGT